MVRIIAHGFGESKKFSDSTAAVTAQAAAIDRLVYGLYGLTAAEIRMVEGQP